MNNAGRAWEEFNTLPTTPPPLLYAAFDPLVPNARARGGRTRAFFVVTTAVVLGIGLALGVLGLRTRSQAKVLAPPPPRPATAPAEPKRQTAEIIPRPESIPDPVPVALPTEKPRSKVSAVPPEPARLKKSEPSLRRDRLGSARPAALPPAPEPGPELKPTPMPAAAPIEEFGMDLTRPNTKRRAPLMDEKDPYLP